MTEAIFVGQGEGIPTPEVAHRHFYAVIPDQARVLIGEIQ